MLNQAGLTGSSGWVRGRSANLVGVSNGFVVRKAFGYFVRSAIDLGCLTFMSHEVGLLGVKFLKFKDIRYNYIAPVKRPIFDL